MQIVYFYLQYKQSFIHFLNICNPCVELRCLVKGIFTREFTPKLYIRFTSLYFYYIREALYFKEQSIVSVTGPSTISKADALFVVFLKQITTSTVFWQEIYWSYNERKILTIFQS